MILINIVLYFIVGLLSVIWSVSSYVEATKGQAAQNRVDRKEKIGYLIYFLIGIAWIILGAINSFGLGLKT